MARADAGGMHNTSHTNIPKKIDAGEYNKITFVDSSTTVAFTGSNAAAGFICEVVTNVVIEAVNGGTIPGTTLTADTLYPIAPQKVTIGASGKVYVLHK
tara:strand:+ start:567 stop:863 length:297 start_codon:yes stop_codon:yes gene_type:complete